MKKLAACFALAVGLFFTLANPASAGIAYGITGNLTKDQQTNYTNGRTINSSGSNIYFQKTDGPAIDLKWYKCSNLNISGNWVYFPNSDPTGRYAIGTNFAQGTVFCLSAWDHGSSSYDTFSGNLWWNFYS